MARHKQPREVAELKGAFRVHPERYRDEVPTSDMPVGDAPGYMSEDAKQTWQELVNQAAGGVLKAPHRVMVEIAANLLAEYRRDPANFPAQRLGHLIGCSARLGMSPTDQQKLGIKRGEGENPFDRWAKQ